MGKGKEEKISRDRSSKWAGRNRYQHITGNEGPSPALKQYLRSRQKLVHSKVLCSDQDESDK